MKELKFRVFDPNVKAWRYFGLSDITFPERLLSQHSYPVQQSTGVRDKLGREIYEGDIVTISNENPPENDAELCVVEWKTPLWAYRIVNNRNKVCAIFNNTGFSEKDDLARVIGNVVDNPEYLK